MSIGYDMCDAMVVDNQWLKKKMKISNRVIMYMYVFVDWLLKQREIFIFLSLSLSLSFSLFLFLLLGATCSSSSSRLVVLNLFQMISSSTN